jgi:hypothetical protein
MKRLRFFFQKIVAQGLDYQHLIIISVLFSTLSGCSLFDDYTDKYKGKYTFEVETSTFVFHVGNKTTTETHSGTIDTYRKGDYQDDMTKAYSSEPKNRNQRLTISFSNSQVIVPEIDEKGAFVPVIGYYTLNGWFDGVNKVMFSISYGSIGSKTTISVTGTRN